MASEFSIAKKYAAPGILVLTGAMSLDDLRKSVPSNCSAIISFGLCGGLAPTIEVGECVLSDVIWTPTGCYRPDTGWLMRLYQCTGARGVPWWSSGEFNTADTKAQRDALYSRTACAVIDDETFAVAQFAAERKIACMAARAASDAESGPTSTLPPAVVNALNANGTTDIEAVVLSVVTDPFQIPGLIQTAIAYKKSLDSLTLFCMKAGANFQWAM